MIKLWQFAAMMAVPYLAFLLGCSIGQTTAESNEVESVAEAPTQQFVDENAPERVYSFRAVEGTQNVSSNQGSIIRWRGAENPGASPLAVLQATKDQLEREQKTKLGSDATARAMVLVMQAIAELEGKQTEMPDGTPIIQ